ncbi:hypothetical protein D5S17_17825 [Pseudonocardiaceae bacterium YIM PH 21723]|nr:hypothetical protein D5S17_17825 [Pseudonocardiaceae bacterium YIM PH 21723]
MSGPFVAYLRVYEPLSAFGEPMQRRLWQAIEAGPLEPAEVGKRERELWLRSQLSVGPRLLPNDRTDRPLDVLTLSADEIPGKRRNQVGPGPLVCPLDVRPRIAAGLVSFITTAPKVVRLAALPAPEESMRARASAVMAEQRGAAVHVVSSTWTVPLPWFVLVDPGMRVIEVDAGRRRVCWRVAMDDARRRIAAAYEVASEALGPDGPTRVLRDTERWLGHFHPHSAVELDYGGLAGLMDDETLIGDTTAEDVQSAMAALRAGEPELAVELYQSLREFWSEIADKEQLS